MDISIRTQIVVEKCAGCPFFERTVVHALADWFAKRDPGLRTGTCKANAGGLAFPLGRIQIPDETRVPDVCPLRRGDVVIQLKAKL
jgi:hypothetical protein